MVAVRCDHGTVVGAVLDGGVVHFEGDLARDFFAQAGVGGDAAGNDDGGWSVLGVGAAESAGEGFADGALEAGGHVVFLLIGEAGGELGGGGAKIAADLGLEGAQDGGFEPGEAKIVRISELCDGEFVGVLIAERGHVADFGTAGVGEAEHAGDFVEGFTGRIVAGNAEELVLEG